MVAPIIWGVFSLLTLVGCTLFRDNSEEKEAAPPPATPPPSVGPCPDKSDCFCSEETGWVPGKPTYRDDHFVLMAGKAMDMQTQIFSVKESNKIGHHFPRFDFSFKLGGVEPEEADHFDMQSSFLAHELLRVLSGKYSCAATSVSHDLVVYVSGHTDRVGEEAVNLSLSKNRALVVAQQLKSKLQERRDELRQAITIEYTGLGEKVAQQKGDADKVANANHRRVEVILMSTLRPFEADWEVLGRVVPNRLR